MARLIPSTWQCDVCHLPDPYNGRGDGIGSCGCPRCDGNCGVADGSALCGCPSEDDGYYMQDDYYEPYDYEE